MKSDRRWLHAVVLSLFVTFGIGANDFSPLGCCGGGGHYPYPDDADAAVDADADGRTD